MADKFPVQARQQPQMVALVIEGHAVIPVIRAKGAGKQRGNLGVPFWRQVDLVDGLNQHRRRPAR